MPGARVRREVRIYKDTSCCATKMYNPATFSALAQRSSHNDRTALDSGADSLSLNAERVWNEILVAGSARPGPRAAAARLQFIQV
jgi:hypothetical protein